jgi:uncharacterized protein (TIRG00374 family)
MKLSAGQILIRVVLPALIFAITLFMCWHFFESFSGGSLRQVLAHIGTLPATTWLLLGVLTCVFYLLDWVRYNCVLRVLGFTLTPQNGLRLTCVSYFVTNLTPTAELHTPAMVYMLRQMGVPGPQALAATLTKSIYMTLWICLVSYLALFFDRSIALPAALRQSLPYLSLPLLGFSLLLGWVAFFPKPLLRWSQPHLARLAPSSLRHKILAGLVHSASSIAQIGRSGQLAHALCHIASLVFLLVYVLIGWILAGQLGFELSFWHALTIFSTSLMIAYLAPVPGAIGVTEIATSYMLDPNLTAAGMAVSLSLRVLCWYGISLPGALVLVRSLRNKAPS